MTVSALRRDSGFALYRQISQTLEKELANQYESGDYLPSEAALAQRFGVNRHTLRHAVDELVAKGLLERQHGKGVRVVGRTLDYGIHAQTRFTETFEAMGKSSITQLHDKRVIAAQGGVARRLQVAEGERIVLLETLRTVDDTPFCVVSHFVLLDDAGVLLDSYQGGSLHAFLAQHYGLQLQRTTSLVTALLPQGHDAHLLLMPRNQPVLRIKSLNVEISSGKPVEYALSRFRSDRVQLSIGHEFLP